MDGMHDLGGRQGFGTVRYTLNAPAFHAAWEVRVNSLYASRGAARHLQHGRVPPRDRAHGAAPLPHGRATTSARSPASRRCCVEKGIVTREELERRAQGAFPLAAPSAPGAPTSPTRERFKPGDRVRVRLDYVPGHVRMPGYIRGKTGVVVSESPAYPFPDAHAHARRGAGRADLRRALPQRGPLAEFGRPPRSSTSACSRAIFERVAYRPTFAGATHPRRAGTHSNRRNHGCLVLRGLPEGLPYLSNDRTLHLRRQPSGPRHLHSARVDGDQIANTGKSLALTRPACVDAGSHALASQPGVCSKRLPATAQAAASSSSLFLNGDFQHNQLSVLLSRPASLCSPAVACAGDRSIAFFDSDREFLALRLLSINWIYALRPGSTPGLAIDK